MRKLRFIIIDTTPRCRIMLSLVISLFLVLKRVSVPHVDALGRLYATDKTVHCKAHGCCCRMYSRFFLLTPPLALQSSDKSLEHYPVAAVVPGVAILRLADPLFFGNINAVRSQLKRIEEYGALHAHPSEAQMSKSIHTVILHVANVPSIDPSALATLSEIAADYQQRGIKLLFVKVQDKIKRLFLEAGVISPLGGVCVFPSTHDAVESLTGRVSRYDNVRCDFACCTQKLVFNYAPLLALVRLYSSHHRRFLPTAESADNDNDDDDDDDDDKQSAV